MPLLVLAVSVRTASAQSSPDLWSIQLHGGLFSPTDARATSSELGVRYCKHFDGHLQLGMLSGWTFKRAKVVAPASLSQSIEPQDELARFDAQLVPLMAFMQVDFTARRFLVPYVGAGGGYEWLYLRAQDDRTGAVAKAKYSNVAWESWVGLGLRLASRVRLNNELYYNGGALERGLPGQGAREVVHVNGVGARVGLDMIFD